MKDNVWFFVVYWYSIFSESYSLSEIRWAKVSALNTNYLYCMYELGS